MSSHQTLREIIALQEVRSAPMYERLKRAAIEREAEHAGLNDMKDMQWRQASADETSAMRVIGWMFIVALGIALGALTAAWWTGQPHLVAAVVECVK